MSGLSPLPSSRVVHSSERSAEPSGKTVVEVKGPQAEAEALELIKQLPLSDVHAHDFGSIPREMVLQIFGEHRDLTQAQRQAQIANLERLIGKLAQKGDVVFERFGEALDGAAVEPVVVISRTGNSGLLRDLVELKRRLVQLDASGKASSLQARRLRGEVDRTIREFQSLILMTKAPGDRYCDDINAVEQFFGRYKWMIRDAYGSDLRTVGQLTGQDLWRISQNRKSAPYLGLQELRIEMSQSATDAEKGIARILERARQFHAARAGEPSDVKLTVVFTKRSITGDRPEELLKGQVDADAAAKLVDAWYGRQRDGRGELLPWEQRAENARVLQSVLNGIDTAGRESPHRTPTLIWLANVKRVLFNATALQGAVRGAQAADQRPLVMDGKSFAELFAYQFDRQEAGGLVELTAEAALRRLLDGDFEAHHQRLERKGQEELRARTVFSVVDKQGELQSARIGPRPVLEGFGVDQLATVARIATDALRTHAAVHGRRPELPAMMGSTVHAGEQLRTMDPFVLLDQVEQALEMGADRIGHGLILGIRPKALTDYVSKMGAEEGEETMLAPEHRERFAQRQRELVEKLQRAGVLIELNMTANTTMLNLRDQHHGVKNLTRAGLKFCVNTDNENILGIDIRQELAKVAEGSAMSRKDVAAVILDGYDGRLGAYRLRNAEALKAEFAGALVEGQTMEQIAELASHLATCLYVPELDRSPAKTLDLVLNRVFGTTGSEVQDRLDN